MAGKPLHFHPEKLRPITGTHFCYCRHSGIVNLLNIFSRELLPLVRLENAEREGIDFAGWAADAVSIVFHQKHHRQFSFFGETNRFKKIALSSCRITDGGDDNVFLAVQLHAPGHAAGGKKLRAGRSRHAPNVEVRVAVVRRHHSPAAAGVSFREVFQTQLACGHAPAQHQAAIAIVRDNVIVRLHLDGNGRERFVAHARDMEMALALAIQVLLAQIRVPALEHDRKKTQFILLAQFRHTMSI